MTRLVRQSMRQLMRQTTRRNATQPTKVFVRRLTEQNISRNVRPPMRKPAPHLTRLNISKSVKLVTLKNVLDMVITKNATRFLTITAPQFQFKSLFLSVIVFPSITAIRFLFKFQTRNAKKYLTIAARKFHSRNL